MLTALADYMDTLDRLQQSPSVPTDAWVVKTLQQHTPGNPPTCDGAILVLSLLRMIHGDAAWGLSNVHKQDLARMLGLEHLANMYALGLDGADPWLRAYALMDPCAEDVGVFGPAHHCLDVVYTALVGECRDAQPAVKLLLGGSLARTFTELGIQRRDPAEDLLHLFCNLLVPALLRRRLPRA
jgi:hypothetical protein